MASDKEMVLAAIKSALEGVEKTPRPDIDFTELVARGRLTGASDWDAFRANFESVRGRYCDSIEDLVTFIQQHDLKRGYCDPAYKEMLGIPLSSHFEVEYTYSRDAVDDLGFAITRGSSVVAETGSILLKDRDTVNRLAAVAPWMHIAVVAESAIYRTVRDAILDYDDDPNIIWVTGPSKTGDIEGILIEGVHGPGEQVCYRQKP